MAIFTIIGQVVGGAFFGPVGAAVGGAIGGIVDSELADKPTGPRINDLRVGKSSYGEVIPLVYGKKNRISGNMIWTSGLKEFSYEKDDVKRYTYSSDIAIALCSGAANVTDRGVTNINRIWCNGKLIASIEDKFLDTIDKLTSKIAEIDDEISTQQDIINSGDLPSGSLEQALKRLEALNAILDSANDSLDIVNQQYSAYLNGDDAGWYVPNVDDLSQMQLPDFDDALTITRAKQSKGKGGQWLSVYFYPGSFTQNPDPIIEASLGAGQAPAYRGTCYMVIESLQLADFGNSIPTIEVELRGRNDKLNSILSDISTRSGIDDSEYVASSLINKTVEGYFVSRQSTAIDSVAPLANAYAFDVVESGGLVKYISRGSSPIASIEDADLSARESGQNAEEVIKLIRSPEYDLPKEATLTYRDYERDYLQNTQVATRQKGNVKNKINQDIALTLDNNLARKIADRLLWESWVGRLTAEFTINDKYSFLNPSDVITLRVAGVMTPFRLQEKNRGINGIIQCRAIMEDPFIYDGYEIGASSAVFPNDVLFVGETIIYPFNAPIIYPSDAKESFTWVMDAPEKGWRGGSINRSVDGIYYDLLGAESIRNVTGIVAGALPEANAEFWDRKNTITVTMNYMDHELESHIENRVLNGDNLCWIGASDGSDGEVIQFATATLINNNPRVYELSDLLRGRRGTEHYINKHVNGETFVLFNSRRNYTASYGIPDWYKSRYYSGASVYQRSIDAKLPIKFTNTGEKSRPRSPVLARADRDTSNNITFTWVRRVRGLATTLGYGNVALDEVTESYEVDVYNGANIVRTIAASSPTCEYTEAQQIADGLTPGNDVTIKIYQISATRGRGHAGEFTL